MAGGHASGRRPAGRRINSDVTSSQGWVDNPLDPVHIAGDWIQQPAPAMKLTDRLLGFSRNVEALYPPTGRRLDVAGRAIHAIEAGDGDGPPLVLIHGASGNVRDFALSILPDLARRHRVIALDRPGFGYSDPLPDHGWRLSDQIAVLRGALGVLGHRRYVLAGHSYGGTLVMRWALNHPGEVAGVLALSAPVMDWGGAGLGLHYEIGGRPVIGPLLARLAPVLAGPRWVRDAVEDVFTPDPAPARYLAEGGVELALRPTTFRVNAVMMLKIYPEILAQHGRYHTIGCPVEIVHGEADIIVPPQIHAIPLSDVLTDRTLTLLPGIGHMPHHARPDGVIAALERLADAAT